MAKVAGRSNTFGGNSKVDLRVVWTQAQTVCAERRDLLLVQFADCRLPHVRDLAHWNFDQVVRRSDSVCGS